MKPAGVLMVPRLAPRGLQRGRSKWFLLLLLLGCGVVGSALDRTQSLKTGTTIAGVVCRDSVVLAADTRCAAFTRKTSTPPASYTASFAELDKRTSACLQVDDGRDRGGQELREDPQDRALHLLLRRRHSGVWCV